MMATVPLWCDLESSRSWRNTAEQPKAWGRPLAIHEERLPVNGSSMALGPAGSAADGADASDDTTEDQPSPPALLSPQTSYEDTLNLGNDLKQTAAQLQVMADRLIRKKSSRQSAASLEDQNCLPLPENECCAETSRKLKGTVAENIRLRQVIKDVTEVNKRWQKYNQERQDYVQRLLAKLQDMQDKVNDAPATAFVSNPPEYRHSDSALLEQVGNTSGLRQRYENAVKENCRLQQEIDEMRENLDAITGRLEAVRAEMAAQAEVQKMQASAFEEDFKAEKKEKEEARSKVLNLKSEVQTLRNKCRSYERKLQHIGEACLNSSDSDDNLNPPQTCDTAVPLWEPQTPTAPAEDMLHTHNQRNWEIQALNIPVLQPLLKQRGGSLKSRPEPSDLVADGTGKDHKPVGRSCSVPTNLLPGQGDGLEPHNFIRTKEKDTVHCPGCMKPFCPEEHVHFLDHFEECQQKHCGK